MTDYINELCSVPWESHTNETPLEGSPEGAASTVEGRSFADQPFGIRDRD
jgi:hypothetical protein